MSLKCAVEIYLLENSYILDCDDGDYGMNCSETCANCSEASECHHITGECSGTCKPGYQGIMCDTGNFNIHINSNTS